MENFPQNRANDVNFEVQKKVLCVDVKYEKLKPLKWKDYNHFKCDSAEERRKYHLKEQMRNENFGIYFNKNMEDYILTHEFLVLNIVTAKDTNLNVFLYLKLWQITLKFWQTRIAFNLHTNWKFIAKF